MQDLIPHTFVFEQSAVRAVFCDDEPWFVGKDVCAALGHSNHNVALERLDEDEKGVSNVYPLSKSAVGGGAQEMVIISEAGVYQLVFTSRTAKAKAFKRWLAHEVLPTLRRTGRFIIGADAPDMPVSADGRLWGIGVAKINAAARMISVASRIYGPEAARRLYEMAPELPDLTGLAIGSLAGTAKDDPEGCLRFLLSLQARSGLSIGDVLQNSLHDKVSARALVEFGLLVSPDGYDHFVAIANAHPWLLRSFLETQWQGDWRLALARLPGAKPAPGNYRFGKGYSKAVLIPRDVILDARSPNRIRH
ncbi:Bro-N domain-containing protein [Bosea massiliensis]|uniref:Bro-N domain-containing protein n=1 Tax=Bosea massiliensis TaxID=151419 RepID=A0ABW0NXH3_9HYPH